MSGHEALAEFPWNEPELGRAHPLNHGLVSIVAFAGDGQPKPAGSGFLIASDAVSAVGVTAAHVFDAIARLHSRHPYRSDHLMPAPLRRQDELDLSPARLMASVFLGGEPPLYAPCTFTSVAWDSTADIAYFQLKLQDGCPAIPKYCQVAGDAPAVGEVIAMLGYADREGVREPEPRLGEEGARITLRQRLVMRVGRVTAHHQEHLWCRGPCIETSIPIFSGMSGCMVSRYVEGEPIRAFGVASHDPEPADPAEKLDRSVAGSSIVALLGAEVAPLNTDANTVLLKLANARFQAAAGLPRTARARRPSGENPDVGRPEVSARKDSPLG